MRSLHHHNCLCCDITISSFTFGHLKISITLLSPLHHHTLLIIWNIPCLALLLRYNSFGISLINVRSAHPGIECRRPNAESQIPNANRQTSNTKVQGSNYSWDELLYGPNNTHIQSPESEVHISSFIRSCPIWSQRLTWLSWCSRCQTLSRLGSRGFGIDYYPKSHDSYSEVRVSHEHSRGKTDAHFWTSLHPATIWSVQRLDQLLAWFSSWINTRSLSIT